MADIEPDASSSEVDLTPNSGLLPVGEWVCIEMLEATNVLWFTFDNERPAFATVELPAQSFVICFTYVDSTAGFSAQGWHTDGTSIDESRRFILRLLASKIKWWRLSREEIQYFELECPPAWVTELYGPQPNAGSPWGAWRNHPKLIGQFLPEFPDDLKVYVHDGGPRITRNGAEAVWVSVRGWDGDIFQGLVLNQPQRLVSVRQGSNIKFIIVDGAQHPIMVTDKYLAERDIWKITPCDKCGLLELFDAPSDLIRAVFPSTPSDATMGMFTAFCPLCGGIQIVTSRDHPSSNADDQQPIFPPKTKRPWWKIWG
jgi:hypothetical protein